LFFAFGDQKACLRRPKTFFEKKVSGLPKNFVGGLEVIYWKTPFSKAFRGIIKTKENAPGKQKAGFPGAVWYSGLLGFSSGSDDMCVRTDENRKVFVLCSFSRPGARRARGKS